MALLAEKEFRDRWSKLHGGAEMTAVVGGWLKISYTAARICYRLKITPDVLTFLGLVAAIASAATSPSAVAAAFLVLSLIADGIDGSVAIVQGGESDWGAAKDSITDRIAEFAWGVALYQLGVPLVLVCTLVILASVQEYARARLGGIGIHQLGVVTPAERPVRAIAVIIAILASAIFGGNSATVVAIALTAMQTFSVLQVLRVTYQQLR
jgi:phosphatidylglycerophosphate synthase